VTASSTTLGQAGILRPDVPNTCGRRAYGQGQGLRLNHPGSRALGQLKDERWTDGRRPSSSHPL
jgi:hypothetical protein